VPSHRHGSIVYNDGEKFLDVSKMYTCNTKQFPKEDKSVLRRMLEVKLTTLGGVFAGVKGKGYKRLYFTVEPDGVLIHGFGHVK